MYVCVALALSGTTYKNEMSKNKSNCKLLKNMELKISHFLCTLMLFYKD